MKKYIIILIVLLNCSSIYADLKIDKGAPRLDRWSITHVSVGAGTYFTARLLKCDYEKSLVISVVFAYFYEIFIDGLNTKIPLPFLKNPDPRGADLISDPLFNTFGAVLSCGIEMLFNINAQLNITNKSLIIKTEISL